MANVETRRDEYTFSGKGCTIRTHLLWAATQLPVYFSEIWARGGSRRGAKGIRTVGQKLQSERAAHAHLCSQIWDVALAPRTDTHTDKSKSASPGQNLSSRARASALFSRDQNLSSRVRASALFSRGRLVSEASLPVFQRGWGRTILLTTSLHP